MKAVNLLPSDLRGAGKPASAAVAPGAHAAGRMGAFAVLGVLAFCVVAFAAYVLTANTVKDRQARLDQATAESAAVTARAAKLQPYADFQAAALARVQTVKDLATSRFDWERALRDLARAIPANVSLTAMSGSISGTGGGGTGDPLRGAIGAPAVTLQGCTDSQRHVADLMSRLHAVRGATRVALSKSERPEAASATVAQPGTGLACRGKRPPTFSAVVFFEHASVPNTVEDVTVSTTASGTPAASDQSSTGSSPQPATGTSTPASTPAPTNPTG